MTRAAAAIYWIETYCLRPHGPDRGRRVRLTAREKSIVTTIYNRLDKETPVTGDLAAFLSLRHLCGKEALQHDFRPDLHTNIFSTWNAVSPELREILELRSGQIVCAELGTSTFIPNA